VDTSQPTLINKLRASARWHEVYRDGQAILFSRFAEPLEVGKTPDALLTLDQYRGDLDRFKALIGI